MEHLWLFYNGSYQYQSLSGLQDILIGNSLSDTITIQSISLDSSKILIRKTGVQKLEVFHGGHFKGEIEPDKPHELNINNQMIKLVYRYQEYQEKDYYIGNHSELIIRDFSLVRHDGSWILQPTNDSVFRNGEIVKGVTPIQYGDKLLHQYIFFSIKKNDILTVYAHNQFSIELTEMKEPTSVMKEKYPSFRRTPRMIYEMPDDKVAFSFPSEEIDDERRGIWLIILPPLMMLIVMGVVALLRPRGIFILISLAMFGTSLITSTVQYFKEKKNQLKKQEKRKRLYTRYLKNKREELYQLSNKQREVLYYHFPSFERMKYLTKEISDRIWERTLVSNDFLRFRIGRARVPSTYDVSVQRSDMSNQEMDDLLEKSQELVAHYKYVNNVPLVIDLSQGSMGMVGKDSIVKKEIQQIVGQLSFSQSYHDIRFVTIFHEEEYKQWEWMKWLPHFQLPHTYAKGFIYNEQTRDQLLSSIYEMLKERDLDEEKGKITFSPHFVFIITNRQLISEHAILEYLEGEHASIGISTIFAADTKESLSEHIHTLVRYIDDQQGDILIQHQKAVHIPFKLDGHQKQDNETFARTLRSLDHQLGMNNSIPEKVTFLQLFQSADIRCLDIANKWRENQSAKSLAVPVGLKGKDDHVLLNLHEKAHGPHGLLAGTTGSGKSEFLQTYILSLAVHFHPYEVAFLLIDYKGGGMAQPFKHIPHLLGTITNIEGSNNFSKRALASIKSELRRRQRLFDLHEVNHIHDYMLLYKRGDAVEPMPHLFLISDEFAELKREEPEFIRELVSAARIGRSLGVHLILATQKPGGIIDDQIWSNARFKIALKVQEESDSKEVLKNGDASKITTTGRGYLQVGNNEVYELFQSAWSGGPYTKDAFGTEDEVALVTDLGLIPLSEVSTEESGARHKKTEIDAVVEEISKVQEELQIRKLQSPWLPPLPQRITKTEDNIVADNAYEIGLVDEPDQQRQTSYLYRVMDDGNIGIFGSSGYGKSTTLLTFLLRFSMKNSPEKMNYYIFDFGNGALLPLQQLPQTGDYFRSDDHRKIEKFFTFMSAQMEERKQLFRDQEVSNIKMYNALVEEELPIIFIVIDNYDLVKEELQEIENRFIQIARDGQSLGIYTILTASRTNAVKHALMSNLKTKIVHYLMDTSDKYAILGKTAYETEAIPGRVYIKNEEPFLAQIYLPSSGESDVEVLTGIKGIIQLLNETYVDAPKPKSIPMLPHKLSYQSFLNRSDVQLSGQTPAIGLDEANVKPVYLDWQTNRHCLILGDAQKGKSNVCKVIIHRMKEKATIGLFDSINHSLANYVEEDSVNYMETKEELITWLKEIEREFERREQTYREALMERKTAKILFSPYILMIDGMSNFQQKLDTMLQTKLANFMKNNSHLGFSVIVSGGVNEFSKGFDPFTNEVKQVKQAILLMKKSEQNLLSLPYTRNEQEIKAGFGYYVKNGNPIKIQIPRYDLEGVTY